jgi:ATP-dependent DNA ligase
LRVRSRRGWNIAPLLPELAGLPAGLTLDGDLVAFQSGTPHFPLVCDRLLHRRPGIKLFYELFDLLALDGEPTLDVPPNTGYAEFCTSVPILAAAAATSSY